MAKTQSNLVKDGRRWAQLMLLCFLQDSILKSVRELVDAQQAPASYGDGSKFKTGTTDFRLVLVSISTILFQGYPILTHTQISRKW